MRTSSGSRRVRSFCPNAIHFSLSYRLIYAVMSKESILLYDSQHALPIGFVDNLNYFDLTSISWTPDGKVLVVSSQEGFNTYAMRDRFSF